MPTKAGITDSGSATADDQGRAPVAQEQPHHQHREDARLRTAAASSRRSSPRTGSTKLKASVSSMSGCAALAARRAPARTPSPTSTSLAPRLRATSKPTTGLPSSSAAARGSATVSLTLRHLVEPDAAAVRQRDLHARQLVRPTARWRACAPTARRRRRRCGRPTLSCCTWRSWREMSAAVAPSACSRAGSSSTRTSRVTPPTRVTAPTPRTAEQRLA